MEIWLTAILQATVSGAILLFLTRSIDRSSANAKAAAEAEKRMIQNELGGMSVRFTSMEQKHEKLTDEIQRLREKLSVLIQRSDDLQTRVFELITTVENLKGNNTSNHGKVVRKP